MSVTSSPSWRRLTGPRRPPAPKRWACCAEPVLAPPRRPNRCANGFHPHVHFRVTPADTASPSVLATRCRTLGPTRRAASREVANNTEPTIRYEILVEGVLDDTWSAWFDGLDVSGDSDAGITSIAGPLPAQAALHGLLAKIRDLGLPLVEVRRTGSDPRRTGRQP